MKTLSKKDLQKKMARTIKNRKIEYIKMYTDFVGDFNKDIYFTNGDSLHRTYNKKGDLWFYDFIGNNWKHNAYASYNDGYMKI